MSKCTVPFTEFSHIMQLLCFSNNFWKYFNKNANKIVLIRFTKLYFLHNWIFRLVININIANANCIIPYCTKFFEHASFCRVSETNLLLLCTKLNIWLIFSKSLNASQKTESIYVCQRKCVYICNQKLSCNFYCLEQIILFNSICLAPAWAIFEGK